jgi:hypothetical protein
MNLSNMTIIEPALFKDFQIVVKVVVSYVQDISILLVFIKS